MKRKTLEAIIAKEKTTFRIDGYTYCIFIDIDERRVVLTPIGSGSEASSDVHSWDYCFSHGGRVYCHAVEIAWEIAEMLPKDTDD